MALAMLLGAAALPALATPLAAQARPAPVRVNIPAQPLGDALAQFAQQADIQLGVDAALVAGLHSPGVTGRVDRALALDRLLAGTGLDWRLADGVLTLQRRPVPPVTPGKQQAPLVTDALRVQGGDAP
ncbi:STN domain-containing protein, partial [Salmonella enterica subsp. enterica serovar Mbandaka]